MLSIPRTRDYGDRDGAGAHDAGRGEEGVFMEGPAVGWGGVRVVLLVFLVGGDAGFQVV